MTDLISIEVLQQQRELNFLTYFMQHLSELINFENVLIYKTFGTEHCLSDLMTQIKQLNYTRLLLQEVQNCHSLGKRFNREGSFVYACLPGSHWQKVLRKLLTCLNSMREVKVLLQLNINQEEWEEQQLLLDETQLASEVLKYCLQYSVLNVVMLFSNFTETLRIYSYKAFPAFRLISESFTPQLKLYAHQLDNLEGFILRAQPDQSEPNTIVYRNAAGVVKVTGFLWKAIAAFAQKHNATLQFAFMPQPGARSIEHQKMLDLTRNGSVDIGVTAQVMTVRFDKQSSQQYTYPVYYGSWCVMLPVEQPIGTQQILMHLFSVYPGLLLLCVLYAFHRLLPLLLRRLDCIHSKLLTLLCCSAAFVLLATYQAKLQSLFVVPPQTARISSFGELLESDLRIFGYRAEFNYMNADFRARYATTFHLTDDPRELYAARNTFNTSYAYTVTSIKWQLIRNQQSKFTHPLFRFADDMCFDAVSGYSFLISPHSIYRKILNHFLLQLQQSGLMDHWLSCSFYDMVATGRMRIQDLGTKRQWSVLSLEHYASILHWFLGGLVFALLAFTLELFVYYFKIFLHL